MEQSREIHSHIIRASAILTNAYVAGAVIGDGTEYNALDLEIDFTKGSLTSVKFKIEVRNDVNYYQQQSESASAGTITVKPVERVIDTEGRSAFLVTPIRAKYVKVSIIGVGTLTASAAAIKGYLCNV